MGFSGYLRLMLGQRNEIEDLIDSFVTKLAAAIEAKVAAQLRAVVENLDGGRPLRRYGKPARGRRLQGQYIGLLRRLSGATRQRVQATARKEGVPAALALAARLEAHG